MTSLAIGCKEDSKAPQQGLDEQPLVEGERERVRGAREG